MAKPSTVSEIGAKSDEHENYFDEDPARIPQPPRKEKIIPVRDGILIRVIDPPKITAGGVHLPDNDGTKNSNRGIVLATGPGAPNQYTGVWNNVSVKEGDTIIYSHYAGTTTSQSKIKPKDGEVILIRENDLLGKVEFED